MRSLPTASPATIAFTLGLAAAGAAQATPAPPGALASDPGFRVPIHTAPDDPDRGPYGVWAAGAAYKASFHDGFAFYPCLGAAYRENLPWRWRTESAQVGGEPIADLRAAPAHFRSEWRYEFRWPGLTEAYDVRADGVEQTFVVQRRPAQRGDLVLTGRVDTALAPAAAIASAHGPIAFADAGGRELVRYGAAFAVDALGRKLAIATTCAGALVRLTVPEAWLRAAQFPVTIDPLTSPVVLSSNAVESYQVGVEGESANARVMIVYTRASSQSDYDVFAQLHDGDFFGAALVFADVGATWSSAGQDVAFAGGADRWALAYTTRTGSVPARGRLYFHAKADRGFRTGFTATVLGGSADEAHGSLALGGSDSGTRLLLAYKASRSSGTSVYASIVDAGSGSIRPRAVLSPAGHTLQWNDTVDVSRSNSATDPGWLVAYSTFSGTFPSLDQAVLVTRVDEASLGLTASFRLDSGIRAHVDGRSGRYLVAYEQTFPFSTLMTSRLDWPASAVFPSFGTKRVLQTGAFGLGVAFDPATASHWCVPYHQLGNPGTVSVARLGASGARTETAALTPVAPINTWARKEAVAYDPAASDFVLLYPAAPPQGPRLEIRRFAYPTDAVNVRYGQGCNDTGVTFSATRPYAGSQFFRVSLRGGTPLAPVIPHGTACVLSLSLSLAAARSPIRGTTGCEVLVSMLPGEHLVDLPATSVLGQVTVQYPLSDAPLLQQDLFGQWLWHYRATTVAVSHGLRMQVR